MQNALSKEDLEKDDLQFLVDKDNQQEGVLHLEDGVVCDKCKNKGFIYTLTGRVNCDCLTQRNAVRKAKNSGLGDLLEHRIRTFKDLHAFQTKMKNKAINYLTTKSSSWFVLLGQSGCGKTHICSAICNNKLENNIAVKYILWNNYTSKMKDFAYDSDKDNYYQDISTVEVLYIDDFLKLSTSAADKKLAYNLINDRYNRNLTTIISSEFLLDEIIELDAAIGSRIKEKSKEYLLQIQRDPTRNFRCNDDNYLETFI